MTRRLWQVEVLALLALLGLRGMSAAADPPKTAAPPATGEDASGARFAKDVVPFLSKHCYACHGNGKRKANLALDSYKDGSAVQENRETFENVLEMVRS